jgi:hypothetical protein
VSGKADSRMRPVRGRRKLDADVQRINDLANGLAAASLALQVDDDETARTAIDETLHQASGMLTAAVERADARARRRKAGAWATGVAAAAITALAITLPPPGTTPQETPVATDERPIDPFERPADIRFPADGPATTEGWLGDREATIPAWSTVRATLPGDSSTVTDVTGDGTPSVEAGASETGFAGVPSEPAAQESTPSDLSAASAALITGLLSSPQQIDQDDVAPIAETGPSEASTMASEPTMGTTLSTTSEPMTTSGQRSTSDPVAANEPMAITLSTTSEPMTSSEPTMTNERIATTSLTARPAPDPSATTAHREAEPIQITSMNGTEIRSATATSPQVRTTATSSPSPNKAGGPPRRTATRAPQAASPPGRSSTTGVQRADRPVVADQHVGRGRSGAAPGMGARVDSATGRSGGVRADAGRPATEATAKNANERGARDRGY